MAAGELLNRLQRTQIFEQYCNSRRKVPEQFRDRLDWTYGEVAIDDYDDEDLTGEMADGGEHMSDYINIPTGAAAVDSNTGNSLTRQRSSTIFSSNVSAAEEDGALVVEPGGYGGGGRHGLGTDGRSGSPSETSTSVRGGLPGDPSAVLETKSSRLQKLKMLESDEKDAFVALFQVRKFDHMCFVEKNGEGETLISIICYVSIFHRKCRCNLDDKVLI